MAETIKLPSKVWDSNWKDDVDVDYAIYGDDEKQEAEYISPDTVSKESIEKIKSIDLRAKFRERSRKIGSVFSSVDMPETKAA